MSLLRLALLGAGINLAVFFALRLAFLWAFSDGAASSSSADLLRALYIGLKFDLRLAVAVSAPLLLLAWMRLLEPANRGTARALWTGYFVAVFAGLMLLYAADFAHYAYTRTRLNGSVLEHLTPADVALQMVWESYPVAWGVLALAAACCAYGWVLYRLAPRQSASHLPRLQSILAVGAIALFCLAAVWGKWSWYPLRWSDAYFSTNPFVSSLAVNPVLFLGDTLAEQGRAFDEEKVREHYAPLAELLEVETHDPQRLSFARYARPTASSTPPAPLNLVLIHLESFAGFKVGAMGNPAGATPHFDALAREGQLFTNFFVPAVPTARSVFTMLTGIPDYHPGRSASRNPLLARQHTLVNALAGHARYYFLGGSASWGNIRGLLTQSIEDLEVYEEGDYAAERADVWGVTDHDVFEKANAVLGSAKAPFFAFIQTSGNHRPYTIPETNLRGFEHADLDAGAVRAAGFDSLAAYNGLRFLDHALGHFFRMARAQPYFRDTVFVLYGDHGNPAAHDLAWERLGLTGFHVPMLIFAPGRIAPGQRADTVASLVDVLPTALGLMAVPHLNKTLGRDLLAARAPAHRFALVPGGVLTDEFFLRVGPQGRTHLYAYRSGEPTTDLRDRLPDTASRLQRLQEGLYHAAQYLLHNNVPQPHAPLQ